MITTRPTEKYMVDTESVLSASFEDAYFKYQAVLPKEAPDLFQFITSLLSLGILTAMCVITAIREGSGVFLYVWLGISVAIAALFVRSVYKYIKDYNAFKNDRNNAIKKQKKKDAFYALFDRKYFLDQKVNATELSKAVSSMLGKQSDNIFNASLRELSSKLNDKNNPKDILCKSLNPVGDLFPTARKRFYFRFDGRNYVFYDQDFEEPKGEIVCDVDDIMSYGLFKDYSSEDTEIITKYSKAKPDSNILKISDGENTFFFEFLPSDYDRIRKLIPSRKEIK